MIVKQKIYGTHKMNYYEFKIHVRKKKIKKLYVAIVN